MNSHLIKTLEKLYLEIPFLRLKKRTDPGFTNWEAKTKRTIKKIFGEESQEIHDFNAINFWYMYSTRQYEKISVEEFEERNFQKGLDSAKMLLEDLIEDVMHLSPNSEESTQFLFKEKKVFISHSSDDDLIGKEVINLLQLIGVKPDQIFFTSAAGYGIPLGNDWVETLRSEVSKDGIVLSLLSENYFKSQICLLEMGATWVLSKLHVPILVPPLTFKETNEVINTKQGFQILEKLKWSSLKKQLEQLFDLEPLDGDKWEPQRDAILARIEKLLS